MFIRKLITLGFKFWAAGFFLQCLRLRHGKFFILCLILSMFFGTGCENKERECIDSPECKKYGACLNDGPNRCVTGCEPLCKTEGLCTPDHSQGLECLAKFNDCREASICREFGRCSAVNGYCIPISDEQCRQSAECGIVGRCKAVNNECMPTSDMDCIRSWGCIFDKKCYLKPGKRSYCGHSDAPSKSHP